ncbi:uncharacterized protein L969DRAFT_81827 [Mixia osmundae IAM 14324]|uniref:uncharacterized protein n=1 Tax=Mixia osmundae (strain CBS 9802 / IAM 14324 / JCM 22182 / KY 12970) TaxID=764103 RepID=UPI0004A5557F|nr:uncharacterized protein L969DRAFT_81827 [Mixia osmundae IAM 14324]KEI39854.1 hypothetical protein L969DRAFT_81827 [Mixia osmundae IAM 14324]
MAQLDDQPQLTFRAISVGLLVGTLLCFANVQFGLQTSWVTMASLQSALVGYAICRAIESAGLFAASPLSAKENVLLQTTAVAVGTMPLAAGLIGVIPALGELKLDIDGVEPVTLSVTQLILWCGSVAGFGIFWAVPLRKQFIVREQLAFPSGRATAEIIAAVHKAPRPIKTSYERIPADEEESTTMRATAERTFGRAGWLTLWASMAISAGYMCLTFAFPVLYALPVFDWISGHALARRWAWYFSPSFSYIGQGIIMGPATVFSLAAGAFTGWAVLSPLAHYAGWAPGQINADDGAKAWILWPALAIMTAESIMSLAMMIFSVVASALPQARNLKPGESPKSQQLNLPDQEEEGYDDTAKDVSIKTVLAGLAATTIACVLFIHILFDGIKPWATLLAVLVSGILSVLGVRALGETDINPVSAIAKISQLLFAFVQPGMVANLIAGGIAESGAQQAGDLSQDLKTGHLLHADPSVQLAGQVIGSAFSVVLSPLIYNLFRTTYKMPSPAYPIPAAAVWLNLARLVNHGHLPPHAAKAMVVAAGIFILLFVVKTYSKTAGSKYPRLQSAVRYFPSGIAFSIGFVITPNFSIARLIGGLIAYAWNNRYSHSRDADQKHLLLIVLASGFVLGEGAASIVGLTLRSLGVHPLSYAGCHSHGGASHQQVMSEQARIVQTRSGRKVTRKTARRKTPAEAVEILEQYFDRARYITELTKDERVSLVEQTGLPDRKICCCRVKANRDQQREDEQHRAAAGSLALGSTSSAYDSLMRLYESATAQRMTSPEPSLTQWSSGSSSDHTSILEQTIAPESYSDMTWLADSITPSALTFLDVHYFCFGNPADPWIAASTGERQCSAHIDTITSDLIYTILDEDKQLHMTMPATSIVSIHLMFVSGTDDASIYVQLSRAPIFTAVSPEEGCLITGDWSPQERASFRRSQTQFWPPAPDLLLR